ncbi:MAG: AIR synthase-related protein [Candidatus Bathyarchaeia archaeon]|jgi:hydrogenase maturation factor
MGKLDRNDLKRLLSCIKPDPKLVAAPKLGFDAGVHKLNSGEYMVVSTDPCIGVPEPWFGWLLIHYVASDISLFGAKTQYCTISLLGPKTAKPKVFQNIMQQACQAADELGITVVTGHTGTYNGLTTLVGVCTGYGQIRKDQLVTPAGAQAGNLVACVKPVGLETVVNFVLTHKRLATKLFGAQRVKTLERMVPQQSCVKEATILAKTVGVNALHDATEGGVTAALNELAQASNVGFRVDLNSFLFPSEVQTLREVYALSDLEVLSLSSTGTVLIAVCPDAKDTVESVLREIGVEVRFVGCFTNDKKRVLVKNGKETTFPAEPDDPYARLMENLK